MYSETYQVTVADLGNYEKEKQIEILVNDHGNHFELKTVVDTVEFEAQADDMFSAFQLLNLVNRQEMKMYMVSGTIVRWKNM